MPPRAAAATLLVLAALTTSACGGGTSGHTASNATTTTARSTNPVTPAPSGDGALAARVILTQTDVGSTYHGVPHDRTSDIDLGPCINRDPVLSGTSYPSEANSLDFQDNADPPFVGISSSVRVAPTIAAAQAAMAEEQGTGFLDCLSGLLKSSASRQSITVISLTLAPVNLPTVGDQSFAVQEEVLANLTSGDAMSGGASNLSFHTEGYNLIFRKGRVLATLLVNGTNESAPYDVFTKLAAAMADHASGVS